MMNKQELEFKLAFQLVGAAVDVMEYHHEEEDIDAALAAVFATCLEIVSQKSLKPMEEIFRAK